MLILFFDTETTGLPDWKTPSDDPGQPHIVQLAAKLIDDDSQSIAAMMNVYVKPDGWEWDESNEAFKTHGITVEQCNEQGVPEEYALSLFMDMWDKAQLRLAYNTTFDNRIIRIALKRYRGTEAADKWKAGDYECTMINSKKILGVSKNPKLADAYLEICNKELEGAHNAMCDLDASIEVFFSEKYQNHRSQADV